MKKKTTVIFLAIIMALTIMPLSATAASTTTVSKGLITSKDAKGPGYNWDASKHTLTLNNANIFEQIQKHDYFEQRLSCYNYCERQQHLDGN